MGLLTSCYYHVMEGNGRLVSEERMVREFDAVVLNGIGNVTIHPGAGCMNNNHPGAGCCRDNDYQVVVTTDSNIVDLVTIEINRNTLYIDQQSFSGIHPTKLEIDVYMPVVRSVNLKGVGNITINDGNTSIFEVSLSGVGKIDARQYQCRNIDVRHSGTGDVIVWANDTLTGRLSGVGDIVYRGNPRETIRRTGVGKVRRL